MQDCAHPSNHHPLLHLTATTASPVQEEEGNSGQTSSPSTSLPVHNASVTDFDGGFVLLKVVPVHVLSESGLALSTYGLLDTAAVSSMISSHIAAKLELQGVPERVSLNTVTYTNQDCELSQVKFHITSTNEEGPDLPVNHALEIEDLNGSNRYCPNQVDLSEWSHLRDVELPNHPVDVSEESLFLLVKTFHKLVSSTIAGAMIRRTSRMRRRCHLGGALPAQSIREKTDLSQSPSQSLNLPLKSVSQLLICTNR